MAYAGPQLIHGTDYFGMAEQRLQMGLPLLTDANGITFTVCNKMTVTEHYSTYFLCYGWHDRVPFLCRDIRVSLWLPLEVL